MQGVSYQGVASAILNDAREPLPKSISPAFADFVDRCLSHDPAARPSARDLLSHPWIAAALAHPPAAAPVLARGAAPRSDSAGSMEEVRRAGGGCGKDAHVVFGAGGAGKEREAFIPLLPPLPLGVGALDPSMLRAAMGSPTRGSFEVWVDDSTYEDVCGSTCSSVTTPSHHQVLQTASCFTPDGGTAGCAAASSPCLQTASCIVAGEGMVARSAAAYSAYDLALLRRQIAEAMAATAVAAGSGSSGTCSPGATVDWCAAHAPLLGMSTMVISPPQHPQHMHAYLQQHNTQQPQYSTQHQHQSYHSLQQQQQQQLPVDHQPQQQHKQHQAAGLQPVEPHPASSAAGRSRLRCDSAYAQQQAQYLVVKDQEQLQPTVPGRSNKQPAAVQGACGGDAVLLGSSSARSITAQGGSQVGGSMHQAAEQQQQLQQWRQQQLLLLKQQRKQQQGSQLAMLAGGAGGCTDSPETNSSSKRGLLHRLISCISPAVID